MFDSSSKRSRRPLVALGLAVAFALSGFGVLSAQHANAATLYSLKVMANVPTNVTVQGKTYALPQSGSSWAQSFRVTGGARVTVAAPLNASADPGSKFVSWTTASQTFTGKTTITATMPSAATTWAAFYNTPVEQFLDANSQYRAVLGNATSSEYISAGFHHREYANGTVLWNSQVGAHEVSGDNYRSYLRQGGFQNLGIALTNELTTPDGVGRYNHFGNGGSIYWTPATGSQFIKGAIKAKWASMGWERSFLHYPTSDELSIRDEGKVSRFQGGLIYWTPQYGAFETHGPIQIAFARQGWENGKLGYPTTDILGDGFGGTYQNFVGGQISADKYGFTVVSYNDGTLG